MITDTDLEHRATAAGTEIHNAVHHLAPGRSAPAPRPSARRRYAIVATAALLIGGVTTTVALRHDNAPATVTSTGPAELPYLLPTAVPDGVTLHRVDTTRGGTVSYAVFAPSRRWQDGAILAQTITVTDPVAVVPDGDCSVRGTTCTYNEYAVDNGARFGMLAWFEGGASLSLQSSTADRAALIAAARELELTNGRIANDSLVGFPRATSGTGPRDARAVTDATGTAISMSITAAPDDVPIDFLPGRPVDVNGRPAWLSHQPTDETSGRLAATITWRPTPGVTVSIYTAAYTDDELLRLARSVAPVTQAEWERLP